MRNQSSRVCRAVILIALFTPAKVCHGTVVVVGDGGNLGAAVAAANHGDVVQIDSNSSFLGTLTWANKFLTIRAGNGFSPTIGAISGIVGNSSTGGEFRGLNIQGPVSISGGGPNFTTLNFYDNTISNTVNFTGVGDLAINSVLQNNRLKNVYFDGTGNLTGNVTLEGNTLSGDIVASVVGEAHYDLNIRRNVVEGVISSGPGVTSSIDSNFVRHGIGGGTSFDDTAKISITRNVMMDELVIVFGAFSSTTVDASNNVIVHANDSRWSNGIRVEEITSANNSNTQLTFVNNTVVGFEKGISIEGVDRGDPSHQLQMSFANMLLQNSLDMDGLLSSEIESSLIADGSFDGLNGNFSGIPSFGPNYELLAGSVGIDRGNNEAASTLLTDIAGNLRILDGNQDGTAVVDVGAYELVIAEPTSLIGFVVGGLLCLCLPRPQCVSKRRGRVWQA